MSNVAKGSEWGKWDLHIHSPLTNLNNQYHGNWEEWVKKLVENEIKVIGLTNYFKFAEENGINEIDIVREKLKGKDIVVFPNLEFRLEQPNKDGDFINLHVLFSNKVSTEKINAFLVRLETHDNKYCSELKTENDFSQAMITAEKLVEKLKNDFKREDYLIICCPNGYGGFRANRTQGRSVAIAEKYDRIAGFFFARKQDREYFLKDDRYEGSIPKTVVFCSDAHHIDGIGGENFTWIKANPTFEGLRQITFEPESRVKIQSDKPEVKKSSDVIESVRFESKDNLFISEPIYFNQNLNVVIGGKSTGKSLLLHSIAKVFDKHDKNINYKHECKLIVKYKDGQEYSLNNKPQRLINYISQGYLQSLVINDDSSHNEFTKLINDSLKENENYLKLSDDFNAKNTDLKSTINLEISNFLSKKNDIKEKTEAFKKLGDIEAKKSELQINLDSIEKIKSESSLTDTEKLEFQSLQAIKADLINKGKSKRQVETYLLELKPLFVQENLKNSLQQKKLSFSQNLLTTDENLINSISDELKVIITEFHSKIESTVGNFDIKIKTDLEQLTLEYQENDKKLKIFQDKLSEYGKINKLEEENENYKKQILAIESAKIELENLKKELDTIKLNIFNSYQEFVNNHINFIKEVNQNHSSALSDVKITSYINFDSKLFYEKYTEKYNLQGSQNNEFSLKDYIFNISKHYEEICKIFEKIILRQDIQFKRGVALKEVFDALFDTSYFSYKFNLTQGNDDILKMSQGKKGIVLLKLYLSQKNAKHPILIDQPEDNLDNRTIYSELNHFIKEKKIDRQIIMVTHNANLVVTTDAEQVIVANQAGEDGKGKKEFQFEYITGALEDTKSKNETIQGVLYQQGIREHVCEILEGGKDAFKKREEKYGF